MRHCAFYSVLYQRDVGSRRVIAPVEATRFHGFPFLWERVPAGSFLPILRALSALLVLFFEFFAFGWDSSKTFPYPNGQWRQKGACSSRFSICVASLLGMYTCVEAAPEMVAW